MGSVQCSWLDSFGLQCLAEGLYGTKTVRFDAAFGAAHGGCRFSYIHFFPVTHQERFPLTWGQLGNLGFNPVKDLRPPGQLSRRLVPIVLCQLEHAVLHDVERRFLIANVVDRALECALFYTFEEVGEFSFGCQDGSAREGIGAGEFTKMWLSGTWSL